MLVDIPEYRLRPKVVMGVRIDNLDYLNTEDEPDIWMYHQFIFSTEDLVEVGDYLMICDGQVTHLKAKDFEDAFMPNTKDTWDDDLLETSHGFDWALMNLKSGIPVKRGEMTVCPVIEDGELHFEVQGAKWMPEMADIRAIDWEADYG